MIIMTREGFGRMNKAHWQFYFFRVQCETLSGA